MMGGNQGGISGVLRDYRKGNWTMEETMVLIEAKKKDDERRMNAGSLGKAAGGGELRWKWVEDYCWGKGCMRSQNQCNDKWDNLMRDFKKLRDYERRRNEEDKSYWEMEKQERKERNLPSNMMPQIYEALVEVVERKLVAISRDKNINTMLQHHQQQPPPPLPAPLQNPSSAPLQVLPLPSPPSPPPVQPYSLPQSQPLPTLDISDTSAYPSSSESPAKRRRGRRGEGSCPGTTSKIKYGEVGRAISKSASIIAEAMEACEEKEERRHRELLSLQQRRLEIEESKTHCTRQGLNALVDAINNLANSLLALASQKARNNAPK